MYELIHAERANIPVARACRALRGSRSGYYKWLHREPSARVIDDVALAAEVKEVFHEHRGRYGAPRVRRALRRRGTRPSKKRVARVMRGLGLRGHTPRRFRKTTDSRHTKRIAPNLLERDFNAAAPNEVLVGDITYIAASDGWLHLAVLLDLHWRAAGSRTLAELRQRLDSATLAEMDTWVRSHPLPADTAAALRSETVGPRAATDESASSSSPLDRADASLQLPAEAWQRWVLMPGLELHLKTDAAPITRQLAVRLGRAFAAFVSPREE